MPYLFFGELSERLILVVTLDVVEDRGEGLAPIEHLATADVASAEDRTDLIRRDHFLILGRDL